MRWTQADEVNATRRQCFAVGSCFQRSAVKMLLAIPSRA